MSGLEWFAWEWEEWGENGACQGKGGGVTAVLHQGEGEEQVYGWLSEDIKIRET